MSKSKGARHTLEFKTEAVNARVLSEYTAMVQEAGR